MLRQRLRQVLREPLVYFLLAAAGLYALNAYWQGDGDARRIVVDRPALLRFLQYRAQTFEPATFEERFDALSVADRQKLIDEYVREEALYREATALGLQRDDDVMRQRLVQKMGFLLESPPATTPTEAQLQEYFTVHQQEYAAAPSITFAHVFVDGAQGDERAHQTALALLKRLNSSGAQFNDAPRYSDRFPYFLNYVERTPDFIESNFGSHFRQELEALSPDAGRWQGPLQSEHGWHLVLVTAHKAGGVPGPADVRAQVLDDYQREQAESAKRRAEKELLARYRVVIGDLSPAASAKAAK